MVTDVGFRVVRFGDVPWEPRTEDEWPCLVKRQLFDEHRDMTVRIVWYARDAVEPRHVHAGTHAAVVLIGQADVDGHSLGPWDIVYGPGNVPHGELVYPVGCMLFATLSGGALHRAVDEETTVTPSQGMPAQMVVERDQPWVQSHPALGELPGECKPMLSDPVRNYSAMLMRFPSGTVEPRHTHRGTHAALILTGRAIVDGLELGPWDLIYGPDGVPHGPITYLDGCTLAVSYKGDLSPTPTTD